MKYSGGLFVMRYAILFLLETYIYYIPNLTLFLEVYFIWRVPGS